MLFGVVHVRPLKTAMQTNGVIAAYASNQKCDFVDIEEQTRGTQYLAQNQAIMGSRSVPYVFSIDRNGQTQTLPSDHRALQNFLNQKCR